MCDYVYVYNAKISFKLYFSWDMRLTDSGEGSHWSDERELGNRALFTTDSMKSFLKLSNIKETDSGVYKCRVDFKLSPTRNSLVNLTVISKCYLFKICIYDIL